MEKNRSKEYEVLGRILVNFETLTDIIKLKIHTQMYYLGLDWDKGQSPMDILLAKMDVDQLYEKFRSLHVEIFTKDHILTNKVNLFSKCMKKLVEIRNMIIHATWFIGYRESTGTEMYFSRGFNDRYGKDGLSRKRVHLYVTNFKKLEGHINELIEFLRGFDIVFDEKKIVESKKISETKLNEIHSFFEKFIKSAKLV